MSRIGKQIIEVPSGTEVAIKDGEVKVTGKGGTVTKKFRSDIAISMADNRLILTPVKNTLFTRALWGTYGSHLRNMIEGVNKPYEKQLVLEGIGFKAEVAPPNLNLAIGFSHGVKVKIPAEIQVEAQKNVITIKGADKEAVGQFAAYIRSQKKPEPYKGKGFRYSGETIRRKQGKKTV